MSLLQNLLHQSPGIFQTVHRGNWGRILGLDQKFRNKANWMFISANNLGQRPFLCFHREKSKWKSARDMKSYRVQKQADADPENKEVSTPTWTSATNIVILLPCVKRLWDLCFSVFFRGKMWCGFMREMRPLKMKLISYCICAFVFVLCYLTHCSISAGESIKGKCMWKTLANAFRPEHHLLDSFNGQFQTTSFKNSFSPLWIRQKNGMSGPNFSLRLFMNLRNWKSLAQWKWIFASFQFAFWVPLSWKQKRKQ